MMLSDQVITGTFFLRTVIYLGAAGLTLRRRTFEDRVVRYLVFYMVVAVVLELILGISKLGWLKFLNAHTLNLIPPLGVMLLSVLLLQFANYFLPIRIDNRMWLALGAVWWIASLALVVNLFGVTSIFISWWGFRRQSIVLFMVITGWVVMLGRTGFLSFQARRISKRPLHKNRLIYWALSFLFLVTCDVFIFFESIASGSTLRLLGVLIITYVVLTHNLIDLFHEGLQSIRYLIIALLSVFAYAIVYIIAQSILPSLSGYSSVISGFIMAGMLVLFLNPLLGIVTRHVNQWVFGLGYDPNEVVREFSKLISNVVDLVYLAKLTLGKVNEAIEFEYGHLFLVDEEIESGKAYFRLRSVPQMEEDLDVLEGKLSTENPVVVRLNQTRRPLTQYDIDLLPQYEEISQEERAWLLDQEVDVYVPIFSKSGWIGLFTLGPKVSGERYFDEDLMLLSTLADQTAVALENARLFSHLLKINQELQRAQAKLEEANEQLREVDELKSSFISVISHELRTPLANIGFSLQILDMYGRDHLLPEQREQLDQLTFGLAVARKNVDNLVMFASFINKNVELRMEKLDFKMLVLESVEALKDIARDKNIELKVDFVGDLVPVKGDRKFLKEAIHHLVHNAVKFTKPGGKIWVSSWATLDAVNLDVRDSGIGIPEEKLAVLWNGFTQVIDPLRRGVEGLGLGLSLVRFVVASHGGKVWAESKDGLGSVFGFCIPASELESVIC